MYDVAPTVLAWRRDGVAAVVVRVVDVRGISSRWPAAAWATDGTVTVGSVLAGAADGRLAGLSGPHLAARTAGLHTVEITDDDAARAGLSCGGRAQVLVQPAEQIPDAAWDDLARARPVALRTVLGGADLGRTRTLAVHSAPPPGVHDTDGIRELVAAYHPASRLLVVGGGLLADALGEQARLLGWDPVVQPGGPGAVDAAAALGPADGLVVLTHDAALDAGPLAAALRGTAGYVAAIGSRATQAARRSRLQAAGVADDLVTARLHGPAGLRIGSATPAEIALSIVAEMLATLRT